MTRLPENVAIITGAASGMGLAGARLFADEGARVVATDVNAEALEAAVASIRDAGGEITGVHLDVTDQAGWDAVIRETVERYGRVDTLVNNAGIHIAKGILEAELDDWNRVIAVNTTGVWLGMKAVIPQMRAAGGGSIVNIASIAAHSATADGGGAAYSASKGAVRSLTKHAAQNFAADRIRVNSILPGSVFTGIAQAAGLTKEDIASGRQDTVPLPPHIGDPIDIAYGMLYLASDEAKYVTGEELIIDGGWTNR